MRTTWDVRGAPRITQRMLLTFQVLSLDLRTPQRPGRLWKPALALRLIPRETGRRRDLDRDVGYYGVNRDHTGRWNLSRTS